MIFEHQFLEMKNVLSYRNKMTQKEVNNKLIEFHNIISDIKLGNIVTTTYSVEIVREEKIFDIEILCPIELCISIPNGYTLKPVFKLTNALKLTHYGNPQYMQKSIQAVIDYANTKGYTPITSIYNVSIIEPNSMEEMDKMQMDIYLGITENII